MCKSLEEREDGLCMEQRRVTDQDQSMQDPAQEAKEFGLDPKENGEPWKSFKKEKISCCIWVLKD